MKIKIFSDVANRTKATPVQIAVCRLIDIGLSFAEAAKAVAISPATAGKIYSKLAETIQAATLQIEDERAATAETKTRQYIQCDTDHFALARTAWPDLTFSQYVLLRTVQFYNETSGFFLNKTTGISTNQIGKYLEHLSEIGALLSLQSWLEPFASKARLISVKKFKVEVHKFFTDPALRSIAD